MGRRTRVVAAIAGTAVLGLACVPPTSNPAPPQTVRPVSVRDVLTRDIDSPPRLDCNNWRYGPIDEAGLPADLDSDNYRYVSSRNPDIAGSQHHLCGQRGPGVERAWTIDQGRNDVLIAVLDSGIKWRDRSAMADLADRAWLNTAELPRPEGSSSYDTNGDGYVSVEDYRDDSRVTDRNANEMLDPEDLILTPAFNDGVDADDNGWVDDISGWDHLWDDNDPFDDVAYGHGTGEARDSVARDGGGGSVGTCPNCRFLPVRVADSFIADGGRFGTGVLFALDSGADVIQEALGAINNPPQAQAAVDAAYAAGVPVVASMADEASKHPNLPAAMNHTIPVNSITPATEAVSGLLGDLGGEPSDYLALNGCTNYGGITWVAVPSNSCSSEATGLGAGMVGLMQSTARTAGLAPNARLGPRRQGDNVLSPNEVAQLLRSTADDVDFSTPGTPVVDPPNARGIEGFERYPTRPGWETTFGFGRVNTYEAVRAVEAGEIPPEADIVSPRWFEVFGTTGTFAVDGSVAATRSSSYSYVVQWAPGVEPPAYPARDAWRTVADRSGLTAPTEGVLGTVSLADVAAALPSNGAGASSTDGRPDEDRFAARVRVVVTDAEGRTAVHQKQFFANEDADRTTNIRVSGAGAPSPVFADLDLDGRDELVVATDDGTVHAYRSDGTELAGWPVHTPPAHFWHAGSRTVRARGIATPGEPVGVGAPLIADLDDDGDLEVSVLDGGGHVSVWNADGTLSVRRSVDPGYAPQSKTDQRNRLKIGFLASPAAGDLDGDGDLEIVAAALDRHVYAWHHDGRAVAGFPVLVVDPRRVGAVDPVSHVVTFSGDPQGVGDGGELIVTPAVADLTGDGKAEIVLGAQEQYTDEPASVFFPLAISGLSANARLYAIWNDGAAHAGPDRSVAHPHDQAYLPNWPVPMQMVIAGVLPLIGNGVNAQAAIGNVDADPEPEVLASSSAGPMYAFDVDGKTVHGRALDLPIALDWLGRPYGARSNSRDGGIIAAAFGGPALGRLRDTRVDVATPTIGLVRALDQLLAGLQPGDTQLMAWNVADGTALPGFPHQTRDLGFFITPAIADVDADGAQEVVAAHGVSLLDAVNAQGVDAPGWPKLTGGWAVGTPGFGDRDGDGRGDVAITRRDGVLMVWRLPTSTSNLGDWPRFGGNGTNSGQMAR